MQEITSLQSYMLKILPGEASLLFFSSEAPPWNFPSFLDDGTGSQDAGHAWGQLRYDSILDPLSPDLGLS